MEELTHLPGVGRKTANVVLGNAFDKNIGVVVDTHVTRVSNRLGLTSHAVDAVKIERDLMEIVPQSEWTLWSHLLIHHGRQICQARKPKCDKCPILEACPAGKKFIAAELKKAAKRK
jgi:endonuclease-3